jgi:hypothetical protein
MNRVVPSQLSAQLSVVLVAASLVTASPAAAAEVTACDKLAAHQFDPQTVAPGVSFADLDAKRAIAACTAALTADAKNPRLRFELGRALERGGNYAEAAKAYRLAADDGYVAAQTALGGMYQNGLGVETDASQAVSWYRKAAEQGYAVAEDNLGLALREGRGVAKNETEAQAWFKKAAAQFYQPAAAHLLSNAAPAKTPETRNVPPPPPTPATAAPALAKPQTPAPVPPPTAPATAPAKPQTPTPPLPAPIVPTAAPEPPSPPPPAPSVAVPAKLATPTHADEAAFVNDPQFRSNIGVALAQCLLPEARQGNHATLDEDQAANLLIAHCQRPWVAWISECIGRGDSQESCIKKSTIFAKGAIRQSSP